MSSEPTPEEQAVLKLKLEDSVGKLIRAEMQKAFKDPEFLKDMFFSGDDTLLRELMVALYEHDFFSAIVTVVANNKMNETMARKFIKNYAFSRRVRSNQNYENSR